MPSRPTARRGPLESAARRAVLSSRPGQGSGPGLGPAPSFKISGPGGGWCAPAARCRAGTPGGLAGGWHLRGPNLPGGAGGPRLPVLFHWPGLTRAGCSVGWSESAGPRRGLLPRGPMPSRMLLSWPRCHRGCYYHARLIMIFHHRDFLSGLAWIHNLYLKLEACCPPGLAPPGCVRPEAHYEEPEAVRY